MVIAPNYIVSALVCAITQQSYTPDTGVHRMASGVVCKPVFSENVKRITAKCFERYRNLATISPEHFVSLKFYLLFIFTILLCFVFFVFGNFGPYGRKVSNDIAPESTPQIHSQKLRLLMGRVSTNFLK